MFPYEDSKTVSVHLSICPHPEKRNHSFVNMSLTLVIDTSMERSSRVLHHGNPKICFFFHKSSKFEFWLLTKSWNHLSFVNMSPTLVIDTSMERSSRVLHHGNPKIWFFFSKKFEIEFCPYPDFPYAEKRNCPGFVDNSPTLVIDTSTERFSRVLQHGNQKIDFSKKFEIEFDLYFDLCWRAEINIQVGRNMHLYVDIGDASSSLWGSTSSYAFPTSGEAYRDRRLTTNFELWVEIFCVSTCFHMRIPKPCLSVCPSVCLSAPREKISS